MKDKEAQQPKEIQTHDLFAYQVSYEPMTFRAVIQQSTTWATAPASIITFLCIVVLFNLEASF